MIIAYNSSIPTNSGYSNLSSDSTDFICTNCATVKGQKGKRRYVEQQPYQTTRTITDHESGEVICSTCGMVISDKIQFNSPEGRNFDQGGTIIGNSAESNALRKRPSSTSSLARHDKGLYTVIGERDNDAYGRQLDPLVRHSMHKIRMYDARTQTAFRDRNRRRAFTELYKLKDKIGLSDAIVEKTAYIYRKAEKRGIIRGRTIPSILAASLYIACREMVSSKDSKGDSKSK